jgi:hypothetical protein
MQTVLVIAVFAAMVLAPCVIASCSHFFSRRLTSPKTGTEAEPEAKIPPTQAHHGHKSPLSDPTPYRPR